MVIFMCDITGKLRLKRTHERRACSQQAGRVKFSSLRRECAHINFVRRVDSFGCARLHVAHYRCHRGFNF